MSTSGASGDTVKSDLFDGMNGNEIEDEGHAACRGIGPHRANVFEAPERENPRDRFPHRDHRQGRASFHLDDLEDLRIRNLAALQLDANRHDRLPDVVANVGPHRPGKRKDQYPDRDDPFDQNVCLVLTSIEEL